MEGPPSPLFLLGRGLQALGLVLLPLGLYYGLAGEGGMTLELTLLAAGAGLFVLGGLLLRPFRRDG